MSNDENFTSVYPLFGINQTVTKIESPFKDWQKKIGPLLASMTHLFYKHRAFHSRGCEEIFIWDFPSVSSFQPSCREIWIFRRTPRIESTRERGQRLGAAERTGRSLIWNESRLADHEWNLRVIVFSLRLFVPVINVWFIPFGFSVSRPLGTKAVWRGAFSSSSSVRSINRKNDSPCRRMRNNPTQYCRNINF